VSDLVVREAAGEGLQDRGLTLGQAGGLRARRLGTGGEGGGAEPVGLSDVLQ